MRIYPSTPIEQHSMLMNGRIFCNRIKKLANPDASILDGSFFSDKNIMHIKRTYGAPGNNISDVINVANDRNIPIYAWFDFDNNTIYLKSKCDKIFLNYYMADYTFSSMNNLQTIEMPVFTSKVTTMSNMFSNCSSLTSLDLSSFDTSNVTNMSYMFSNCSSLTSLDLSNFNTSNLANMYGMFSSCSSLTSLDVSHFDTSNVTSMSSMFHNCIGLTLLDVSNFNTSKVTTMSSMFSNCNSLTSLDLSNFDTSNVTSMSYMFSNCSSLTSLDLSNFDTSNVTDMSYMFNGCHIFKNLIGFDTLNVSSVINVNRLFGECTINSVSLPNFCNDNLTNFGNMFYMSNIQNINMENVTAKNINDISSIYESAKVVELRLPLVKMKISRMYYTFRNCTELKNIFNLSNFDTSKVTTMNSMFSNCQSLASLDLSSFDTSNVTTMSSMFNGCNSLASLDLSNFDTSNVTTMSSMFNGCNSLTSLDLSNFDTSNVTSISAMFYNCSSLTSLDLSNFDTSNVKYIGSMFSSCYSLTSLDLSGFDTSNVTDMSNMFYESSRLNDINYGNNFIITDEMLDKCVDISNYNNPAGYMFYKCPANKPNHITWIKNGAWNGHTYLKKSILECGTVFNQFIRKDITKIVGNGPYNSDIRINCCINGDDRVFISMKNSGTILSIMPNYTASIELNEDCSGMFKGLPELTNIDISHQYFNYNGAKTRNWKEMFADNPKLTTIIYPTNFDIPEDVFPNTLANDDSNPTWHMFHNSPNATKPTGKFWDMGTWNDEGTFIRGVDIDITKFKQYVNNKQMTSFKKADAPPESMVDVFDISKDGNMAIMTWFDSGNSTQYWYSDNPMIFMDSDSSDMFNGSNVCISIDLSGFDTRKTENMLNMFYGCSKLASLDVSHFDTSNVTSMSSMFNGCESLTSLDLSNFDTSNVTDMSYMFYNCLSLTSLDLSNFDTSKVTNMSSMFQFCRSLTSLDVSSWNTSKVISMSNMFRNCSKLTSLNVSNFDTSNVTSMGSMFSSCYSLTSLDLSGFDTSNVTNMTYMFNYCSSLTSLDLSNFDTSNVTNMNSMFKYCSSLTSLDLSNFDTSSAYKSSYVAFIELFSNCPNLLNIIFSNKFILDDSLYNTVSTDGKVSATNMMYKECPANKPTGGNWDLGTWDGDGTFIKNT